MKIKDNVILTKLEVRKLYPNISFNEATYAELGWVDYVPPVEPAPEPVIPTPGWGDYTPPPPTPEEQAAIAAFAAQMQADLDFNTATEVAVGVAKVDPVVKYLREHTPEECEAYVQANVTDLASAKAMMKKFAVALCVLTRKTIK
jgi:hypothetical protein